MYNCTEHKLFILERNFRAIKYWLRAKLQNAVYRPKLTYTRLYFTAGKEINRLGFLKQFLCLVVIVGNHFGVGDSFCGYYCWRDAAISARFTSLFVKDRLYKLNSSIFTYHMILIIASNLQSRRTNCYLLSTAGAFF